MMAAGASLWIPTSSAPQLAAGEVHLWRFPLASSPVSLPTLKSTLAADELQRAARLLDPRKAASFIVARARLRQILASYLAVDPAEIAFTYGEQGKPALLEPASTLTFNLSHSGAWALLAVAQGMEIGVDLEQIDPFLAYERLAARFFSPEENAALLAAPEVRRRRQFYRLWTRKEAQLKGVGGGFSAPGGMKPTGWSTRSFWLGRGYVATLASILSIGDVTRFCVDEG